MIEIEHLTIGYKDNRGGKRIVATDLNGTLRRGSLTCLVGPNGCGKSTLLRTIAGLQPSAGGNVYYQPDGDGISSRISIDVSMEKGILSHIISIVLTDRPGIRNMTVREIVSIGRQPYTGFWGILNSQDREIVDESMRLVGIESLAGREVQTLSDGERQKMMIAKALAQQTPVIILDEPTAFLDYPSKVETLRILARLCHEEGKTVVLSTHDMETALQLADAMWLIDGGTMATGTPSELASTGIISRFIDREGIRFDSQTMTIRIG